MVDKVLRNSLNVSQCSAKSEDYLMEENVEKFHWSSQTTKLLIEEIRNNLSAIHNKNNFPKKKWKIIANNFHKHGYNITDEQCSTKWKNLKQKYKSVKDNNNRTGQGKESWEYYEIMDNFFNVSPEMEPVSLASSTHGFRIRQPSLHVAEMVDCNNENNPACNTSYGKTRNIRIRKNNDTNWMEKLYNQRKRYYKKQIKNQVKFLTLFEKYIQRDNAQ